MPGELTFYKNDLNNFGIQIYREKANLLEIDQVYSNYYDYSINLGLNSKNNKENTFVIFYKDYLDLNDDLFYQDDGLTSITEDNMTMTVQSYYIRYNQDPEQYLLLQPFLNFNFQNYTFMEIYHNLNLLKILSDESIGNIIQDKVNQYIDWAWQWYNQSTGFFRNSIIETVNVLSMYMEYESLLEDKNKMTFLDSLTLINTTLQNYAYQYYGTTKQGENSSIISIDYPAEELEGEIERKYNLLSILDAIYTIYGDTSEIIIDDLIERNVSTDIEAI